MPANYRRLLACAVLGIDSSRSFEFSLDAAKTRLLSRIIILIRDELHPIYSANLVISSECVSVSY